MSSAYKAIEMPNLSRESAAMQDSRDSTELVGVLISGFACCKFDKKAVTRHKVLGMREAGRTQVWPNFNQSHTVFPACTYSSSNLRKKGGAREPGRPIFPFDVADCH